MGTHIQLDHRWALKYKQRSREKVGRQLREGLREAQELGVRGFPGPVRPG